MQLLDWKAFPIQTGPGIPSGLAGVGDNKGRLTGFYGYELTCETREGKKGIKKVKVVGQGINSRVCHACREELRETAETCGRI